jgi:hypothetical protein
MPYLRILNKPLPKEGRNFLFQCDSNLIVTLNKYMYSSPPGLYFLLKPKCIQNIRKDLEDFGKKKKEFFREKFNYLNIKIFIKSKSKNKIMEFPIKKKNFFKIQKIFDENKNEFHELFLFISKTKHKGCFDVNVKNFSKNSRFVGIITKRRFSKNVLNIFVKKGFLDIIAWKCAVFTKKKKYKIKLCDELFLEYSSKKNSSKDTVPCLNCQFLLECSPQGKINPYRCFYLK